MKKNYLVLLCIFVLILLSGCFETEKKNTPPTVPTLTSPVNNMTNVPVDAMLGWKASSDIDGDNITYDVFFGTTGTPMLVSSQQSATSYNPILENGKTYYWKISANDGKGGEASSPIWKFTTVSIITNVPPIAPVLMTPINNSTGVNIAATLTWNSSSDSDGDVVQYDIYLDTNSSPSVIVAANHLETSFATTGLAANTKYYWKVVAKDGEGGETSSNVFNFTTENNTVQKEVVSVTPKDTSTITSDGSIVIKFSGAVNPATVTEANIYLWYADTNFDVIKIESTVTYNTTTFEATIKPKTSLGVGIYTLNILGGLIKDMDGVSIKTIAGLTYYVKNVQVNSPPIAPGLMTPIKNATGITTNTSLSWSASTDADEDIVSYDVYLDTNTSPSTIIIADTSDLNYSTAGLAEGTTYYWKVVAKDGKGKETPSEVWSFTTITTNVTTETSLVFVIKGTTIASNGSITVENDFYIGKYEVTQSEFEALMGYNPSGFKTDTANNPVESLTWYDAVAYCNALSVKESKTPFYNVKNIVKNGNSITSATVSVVPQVGLQGYRLPTASEWDYASRGGKDGVGFIYSGSNTAGEVAWYQSASSLDTTNAVGLLKANELGIYDMSGNVWEWTNTRYSQGTFYKYGGGWFSGITLSRVGKWGSDLPKMMRNDLGFRIARTETPLQNLYTLTYDGNGNTNGKAPDSVEVYKSGQEVFTDSNYGLLEKTDNTFAGWNTKVDGTGISYAEGDSFNITEDTILYAKWTPKNTILYNVSYDGNGSTGGSVPSSSNVPSGQKIFVMGNSGSLVKTGFNFDGWNTKSDGTGISYTGGTEITVNADVTLFAQWIALEVVSTPVFSPVDGTYSSAQTVFITSITTDATIHYTTDGSTPTNSSAVYSIEGLSVTTSQTIKAIAIKSGMSDSEVAVANYIINTVQGIAVVYSKPMNNETGIKIGVDDFTWSFSEAVEGIDRVYLYNSDGVQISSLSFTSVTLSTDKKNATLAAINLAGFLRYGTNYKIKITYYNYSVSNNEMSSEASFETIPFDSVQIASFYKENYAKDLIEVDGKIYFSDTNTGTLKYITETNTEPISVVTFSSIGSTRNLCADNTGNIYLIQSTSKILTKVAPDGTVTTYSSLSLPFEVSNIAVNIDGSKIFYFTRSSGGYMALGVVNTLDKSTSEYSISSSVLFNKVISNVVYDDENEQLIFNNGKIIKKCSVASGALTTGGSLSVVNSAIGDFYTETSDIWDRSFDIYNGYLYYMSEASLKSSLIKKIKTDGSESTSVTIAGNENISADGTLTEGGFYSIGSYGTASAVVKNGINAGVIYVIDTSGTFKRVKP